MPELPLDNVQWGNAVYLKHFRTSYQTKFRDPKEVIQDKLSQVQATKDDQLDELVADELDVESEQDSASSIDMVVEDENETNEDLEIASTDETRV